MGGSSRDLREGDQGRAAVVRPLDDPFDVESLSHERLIGGELRRGVVDDASLALSVRGTEADALLSTFGEGQYLSYGGSTFRIVESFISDDSERTGRLGTWRVDIKAVPPTIAESIKAPRNPLSLVPMGSPWTDVKIRGFDPEEENSLEWDGPLYDA